MNANELKELKDLLDNGVITQEDFDAKKEEYLNSKSHKFFTKKSKSLDNLSGPEKLGSKRQISKKKGCLTILGIFILLGIIGAILGDDATTDTANNANTANTEIKANVGPKKEEDTKTVPKRHYLSKDAAIDSIILPAARISFDGKATIEYNKSENALRICPINDVRNAIIVLLKSPDSPELKKPYMEMVDQFKSMSKNLSQNLKDSTGNGDLFITLVNPLNTDRELLILQNGEVVYNFIN